MEPLQDFEDFASYLPIVNPKYPADYFYLPEGETDLPILVGSKEDLASIKDKTSKLKDNFTPDQVKAFFLPGYGQVRMLPDLYRFYNSRASPK